MLSTSVRPIPVKCSECWRGKAHLLPSTRYITHHKRARNKNNLVFRHFHHLRIIIAFPVSLCTRVHSRMESLVTVRHNHFSDSVLTKSLSQLLFIIIECAQVLLGIVFRVCKKPLAAREQMTLCIWMPSVSMIAHEVCVRLIIRLPQACFETI